MGYWCREKGHWSHWGLRVIPVVACGPSLALPMRRVEKQQSEEKEAPSPHEMNHVRGMDGDSSSLKHIITYLCKASSCSKGKKNQRTREDKPELNIKK